MLFQKENGYRPSLICAERVNPILVNSPTYTCLNDIHSMMTFILC